MLRTNRRLVLFPVSLRRVPGSFPRTFNPGVRAWILSAAARKRGPYPHWVLSPKKSQYMSMTFRKREKLGRTRSVCEKVTV